MGMAISLKKLLLGRAFSAEGGKINMFGKLEWTLYPSRGLAAMLQDYGEKSGERALFEIGYENGKENGNEMIAAMGIKPRGGWVTLKAIQELLDFTGYGHMEFIKSHSDKSGHHHLIIHIKNNPVVEHAHKMYGKKSMACAFFRGLFSGHGEAELGWKNIKLKENKCLCNGSPYCEYESKW